MTNQEKKEEHFQKIISKYKYLERYCKIEVTGLDDESIYFHVTFKIADDVDITSQSDVSSNHSTLMYALRVNIINNIGNHFIDLSEDLLGSIVIGYHTNKDVVMLALATLGNIRHHINQLNMYTSEYVNNILIGNSIKETTHSLINELNTVNKTIEFLQKQ
jgi:hypothetical protein